MSKILNASIRTGVYGENEYKKQYMRLMANAILKHLSPKPFITTLSLTKYLRLALQNLCGMPFMRYLAVRMKIFSLCYMINRKKAVCKKAI